MLDWLRYDIRHALRRLLLGANSAIFSLVDQAL